MNIGTANIQINIMYGALGKILYFLQDSVDGGGGFVHINYHSFPQTMRRSLYTINEGNFITLFFFGYYSPNLTPADI